MEAEWLISTEKGGQHSLACPLMIISGQAPPPPVPQPIPSLAIPLEHLSGSRQMLRYESVCEPWTLLSWPTLLGQGPQCCFGTSKGPALDGRVLLPPMVTKRQLAHPQRSGTGPRPVTCSRNLLVSPRRRSATLKRRRCQTSLSRGAWVECFSESYHFCLWRGG